MLVNNTLFSSYGFVVWDPHFQKVGPSAAEVKLGLFCFFVLSVNFAATGDSFPSREGYPETMF